MRAPPTLRTLFTSRILYLVVGLVIIVLGASLSRTAWKRVGGAEIGKTLGWLLSKGNLQFLGSAPTLRFFAIAALFLSLVYLYVPRIDFFLASILFLTVFINLFYFDDDGILKKMKVCRVTEVE